MFDSLCPCHESIAQRIEQQLLSCGLVVRLHLGSPFGVSGVMAALQVVALADVVRIRTIPPIHDALAQSVEHRTFNAEVLSSSLRGVTTYGRLSIVWYCSGPLHRSSERMHRFESCTFRQINNMEINMKNFNYPHVIIPYDEKEEFLKKSQESEKILEELLNPNSERGKILRSLLEKDFKILETK